MACSSLLDLPYSSESGNASVHSAQEYTGVPTLHVLTLFSVLSDLIIFASLLSVNDISLWSLIAGEGKHLFVVISHVGFLFCELLLSSALLALGLFVSFLLILRSSSDPNDLPPGYTLPLPFVYAIFVHREVIKLKVVKFISVFLSDL